MQVDEEVLVELIVLVGLAAFGPGIGVGPTRRQDSEAVLTKLLGPEPCWYRRNFRYHAWIRERLQRPHPVVKPAVTRSRLLMRGPAEIFDATD